MYDASSSRADAIYGSVLQIILQNVKPVVTLHPWHCIATLISCRTYIYQIKVDIITEYNTVMAVYKVSLRSKQHAPLNACIACQAQSSST